MNVIIPKAPGDGRWWLVPDFDLGGLLEHPSEAVRLKAEHERRRRLNHIDRGFNRRLSYPEVGL